MYKHDSGSPATDFLKPKLRFNSVTSHAKQSTTFLIMDLKDIFLHTPIGEI